MMGQAAGTAAAIAAKYDTTPRSVYEHHIRELQQALLKDGCYLPGVRNTDKDDIALRARVTASSSRQGMAPEKVNNGWNRIVGKDRNAWAPDPDASLPQWIQLKLDEPTAIDTIHATFQRTKDRAIDFAVETWSDGSWRAAATVRDNKSRRCVVNFQPVETDRIRLVINKTAGQFAVCEIRLYNETHKDANAVVHLRSEMQNARLYAFQSTNRQ
jgi:hypothetical protein